MKEEDGDKKQRELLNLRRLKIKYGFILRHFCMIYFFFCPTSVEVCQYQCEKLDINCWRLLALIFSIDGQFKGIFRREPGALSQTQEVAYPINQERWSCRLG